LSRKKAILDQSKLDVIYLILNILFAILLVPYYLNFISIELYGFWLATSGVVVLLEVFDLGINTLFIDKISRFYSNKNHNQLINYLYSGILLFAIISILINILGLGISYYLDVFFKLDKFKFIIVECFRLSIFTASIKIVNSVLVNFGSSVLKPSKFSLIKIISTFLSLVVVVILLNNNFELYSLAFGYLFQQVLALLLNIVSSLYIVKKITGKYFGKIKISIIYDFIINSKYLFISKLSDAAVKSCEPIFIANSLGPKSSSIYILSKKAADIIYQIINVFTNSTFTSLISINEFSDSNARSKLFLFQNAIYFSSTICLSFYILLNNEFLLIWVGPDFIISKSSIILFAFSSFLMILMHKVIQLEFSKNKIQRTSRLLILESIFRVLLLYILINTFGFNGGPISVIVSVLLFMFFVVDNPIFYRHIYPTLLIFLSSVLILFLNFSSNLLFYIPIKIILHSILIGFIFYIFTNYRKDILSVFNYIIKNEKN
jgi:O-antigen/teichoic acid export membrane protein